MHRFDKEEIRASDRVGFETSLSVRFQDVDAAGIVYFARFFDYVHAAYEEFLARAGHPLPGVLRDGEWAAPLRHAEADYLSPVRFGDVLSIQLVLAHVDETEISLAFRLLGPQQRPVAIAQTVHTFVALPSFQRRAVPGEIVEALQAVCV